MINKISRLLDKMFKNNYTLWFIKYYNLIVLILFTLGCFIYLTDYKIFKDLYIIFISILGFNLSGLVFVGYVVSRLKFCEWQILAYVFNVLINILWLVLKILTLFIVIKYDLIIITTLSIIFLIYTLIYYFKWKKKQ